MIHRLPKGESVVRPRSRCPACGRGIAWHENIPVISFLLLRGRCRGCAAAISWRYPLVEALTGALFLLAAWVFVVRWPGGWKEPARYLPLAVAFLYLAALVALTFIDFALRILPDRITKPGIAAGVVLSVLLPGLQDFRALPSLPPSGAALVLSLAGAAIGYGSLWFVGWAGEKAFRKEAMGLGDCKLLAMIGAFTGPVGVLLAAACGLVLGLLLGLVQQARTKDPEFPFGPALAAGGAAVFLAPKGVLRGFAAGMRLLEDPRVELGVAAVLTLVLLSIRRRLPRALFVAFLVLLAVLAGTSLLLMSRAGSVLPG